MTYYEHIDNENEVFELAYTETLEDLESNENDEESSIETFSITSTECMKSLETVQKYFQFHGASSKIMSALTEAENKLVTKKASENQKQSRMTNYFCKNPHNENS